MKRSRASMPLPLPGGSCRCCSSWRSGSSSGSGWRDAAAAGYPAGASPPCRCVASAPALGPASGADVTGDALAGDALAANGQPVMPAAASVAIDKVGDGMEPLSAAARAAAVASAGAAPAAVSAASPGACAIVSCCAAISLKPCAMSPPLLQQFPLLLPCTDPPAAAASACLCSSCSSSSAAASSG